MGGNCSGDYKIKYAGKKKSEKLGEKKKMSSYKLTKNEFA